MPGVKTPTLATEGEQVLSETRLAAHPQKAMFQPATFEKFFKFPLHIARQFPALFCYMRCERRVLLVNDLIEKSLLGAVTWVTTNIPIQGGHPGRRVGHDPRPCVTVFLECLRLFPGT